VTKEKQYVNIRFSAEVLREAMDAIVDRAASADVELDGNQLKVDHDDSTWRYDQVDEFFADYRKYSNGANFCIYGRGFDLTVFCKKHDTYVSVKAPSRADVVAVCEIFDKHAAASKVPAPPASSPTVFIGHGRSPLWRELKDHLQDKHGIRIEAYETGARAGHSIRDILEEMIEASSFAVLVMSGEDAQSDGGLRARQNVIHEAGLFQGKLGFARAILLLEEGVEPFSNVQGVQYIPFSKGNIKETFGEVLATIRREFPQ
jgi:predicted nucleotide-binding protein